MKTNKLALYIVLLPISVIVVASSLFLAMFDANDYKQELADLVQQSSGRSLTFKGDAELMLYPDFGMKLGAMQFSNAPGFGTAPMLSVDEVSISVDVKSVFMLQPRISQLILSELQIDLQKNKQGITNWHDLIPEKTKQTTPSKPQKAIAVKDGAVVDKAEDFQIVGAFDGINIKNARVFWRDAMSGESMSVDDLDFTTGKITPTDAFPLSLQLLMHKEKDINVALNFKTEVFFDLKKQHLSLKNLDLKLKAHGALIPVKQSDLVLQGNVGFDLDKQMLDISKLSLTANTSGGVMEKTSVTLGGDLTMDLTSSHLTVNQLNLQADIVDVSMPKGQIKASVQAQKLDLKINQRAVSLSQLKLGLNNIEFTGDVHISDYAQPALIFDLSSKAIDLDNLLGLDKKPNNDNSEEASNVQNGDVASEKDIEIALPIALLKSLDVTGKLTIDNLKVMNVTTANNRIHVTAKKGLIEIKPLGLDLYEGSIINDISLDVRSDKPIYKIKTDLKQVQIGDLLIDFLQLDKIRGAATIGLNAETQGTWVSELKKNLNGDVALRFENGALKGFNLRHLIDSAKAKLSKAKAPEKLTQETDFTELTLSGVIKNGVFSSDDLSLKSPLIRIGGEGQADLNNDTVDYTVNAKVIGSLEGQAGEGQEAKGLLIPVRIFGAFASPEIDVLLDNMLRQAAEKKLAEAKAAFAKELTDKKAVLAKSLADKKAALKAQQQKLIAAKKAEIEAEKQKLASEIKAKLAAQKKALEAKKQKARAELEAKKQAVIDKEKKKLEDKLKGLFR